MHVCIFSSVSTTALVLKHQAISSHSADKMFIVLDQFHSKLLKSFWKTLENEMTFWKKYTQLFKG